MKKVLAFLLTLLLITPAWAETSLTVEDLESKMGYDIDTADADLLKVIINAWETELTNELRVYDELIQKCLARLVTLGETEWVNQYSDIDKGILSMSYSDLVALKDQINLAIWQSQEWQEVTVPHGLWVVGKDIPAGTWTVRCADSGRESYLLKSCELEWGDTLEANGQGVAWSRWYDSVEIYNPYSDDYKGEVTEYTFTVREGDYIYIDPLYNKAVFTPYTGKPSLGFK